MNDATDYRSPFGLGPWLVQPELNRVQGPGGPVTVEPRVMRVLLCLAARPGEVWSRQALLDEVWGDTVVGEEILTRAISELRRVFGDKARDPRFIETIRHHGYRLITDPVEPAKKMALAEVGPELPPSGKNEAPRRRFFPAILFVFLLAAVALLAGSRWFFRSQDSPGYGPAFPLTSFPGREYQPALSEDGTRVAFVWSAPGAGSSDLYVKQRNSETLLRLTETPDWVAWPTWSPDGQDVAFVQGGPEGNSLNLVPSFGGVPRSLQKVSSWVEGLDFSPDGRNLLYAARSADSGKFGIYCLDLDSLQAKPLLLDADQRAGDFQPCFAPDGHSMAWVGVGFNGNSALYIAGWPKGPVQRVGGEMANVQGLAYAADGRHLLFAASPTGTFNLWRVRTHGGLGNAPELIPTPGGFAWNPAVARRDGAVVFEQVNVDQDIWQVRILERDPWRLETASFLQSTRWEYEASFNSAGTQVAFISARSGSPEVWLAAADGTRLQKLTSTGSTGLSNLRWSPDDQWLAFNALQNNRSVIMVAAVGGGKTRLLTPKGQDELLCSWSADGGGLLFGSRQSSGWEIRRRGLQEKQSHPVVAQAGASGQESPGGRTLYYTRSDQMGLWRVDLNQQGKALPDRRPQLVLENLARQDEHNWVLLNNRIYWVFRTTGTAMLALTDLSDDNTHLVTELPGLTGGRLTVSPDETTILYPRTKSMTGDLMVLPSAP